MILEGDDLETSPADSFEEGGFKQQAIGIGRQGQARDPRREFLQDTVAPVRHRTDPRRYGMRDNGKHGWYWFHVSMLNTMQPVTIRRFHSPDGGPFSGSLRLRSSVRAKSSASVSLSKAMMTQ